MFHMLKDQILKSTESGTKYRYRWYFLQKYQISYRQYFFGKSICAVIVGTLKVPSAHLW